MNGSTTFPEMEVTQQKLNIWCVPHSIQNCAVWRSTGPVEWQWIFVCLVSFRYRIQSMMQSECFRFSHEEMLQSQKGRRTELVVGERERNGKNKNYFRLELCAPAAYNFQVDNMQINCLFCLVFASCIVPSMAIKWQWQYELEHFFRCTFAPLLFLLLLVLFVFVLTLRSRAPKPSSWSGMQVSNTNALQKISTIAVFCEQIVAMIR